MSEPTAPDPKEFIPAKDIVLCAFFRPVEGNPEKMQLSFMIGAQKDKVVVNSCLVQLQAMILANIQEDMYARRAAAAPKIMHPGGNGGGIMNFMRRK